MRLGAAAAGQADHRHDPVAAGGRSRRAGHRHHRTAGVRRTAGARRLDPLPGHRHPARRRAVWCSPPIPPGGIDASRNGLFVRANADVVVVAFRDSVAAVAPRRAVDSGACSTLHLWANAGRGRRRLRRHPRRHGHPARREEAAGRGRLHRSEGGGADGPVSARSTSTPGSSPPRPPLKLAVMVLGVLVRDRLDRGAGAAGPRGRRGASRHAWRRFWRVGLATWLADAGVVGTLLLWHIIGALSSDDGYNLTIARVSGDAGYIANYYRYFGATEAPVRLVSVRARAPRVDQHRRRVDALPATAGRHRHLADPEPLGAAAARRGGWRRNRVAVWTAGAVFLAAWLPFNNGLRPEPLIAFGVIAVWVLVENAIGTRRLWPVAAADRRRRVLRDAGAAGPDRAGAAAGRRPRRRPDHPRPPRDRRLARAAGPAGRRRRR